MGLKPSKSTPFLRFESEYLACWETAQEAKAKLNPSSVESVLGLMCIALLQHFEKFCIEQCIEIATLRPKLVRNVQPSCGRISGEVINRSFSKLVKGDVLSNRELKQLRKIVRAADASMSHVAAKRPHEDWTAHLDAIFELAVTIARSTGSATAQGLNVKLKEHRKIAATAARLLRARYDSLA